MSFTSIFKKASNLLGLGGAELKPPPLDGEIIYCKNNVCVHPPASLSLDTEHHPGYLTLRAQQSQNARPTLILTWIPNTTLKKNPHSIEGSPNKSTTNTPRISPRRNPKQEFAKSDNESVTLTPSSSPGIQEPFHHRESIKKLSNDSTVSVCSEASSYISSVSHEGSGVVDDLCSRDDKLSSSCKSQTDSGLGSEGPSSLKSSEINPPLQNNEKHLQSGGKPPRVGVRVNNLNCNEKGVRSDMKNLELQKEPGPNSDDFTSEEQMVAMMNRNKLHAKTKERAEAAASKPVSITIKGDNLVVVTEQQANLERNSDDDPNINRNESKFETSSSQSADNTSISSGSNNNSPSGIHIRPSMEEECLNDTDGLPVLRRTKEISRVSLALDIPQTSNPPPNTPVITPDISITKSKSRCSSSSSTTTSGPDSRPATPFSSEAESDPNSPRFDDDSVQTPESPDSTCSSAGLMHNMTFPENSMSTSSCNNRREKRSAKDIICGVFSVDLGQMRSLRLFYNDKKCTQGQVVIASRESQYKILHFHTGGLDKLAEIFDDWSLFAIESDQEPGDGDKPYRQFLVVKPHISDDQCHPEEHLFSVVTDEAWQEHMTAEGAFENVFQLRKEIFFGGLDPMIRPEVWPFLLHYYPFLSTVEDRERIRNDKYIEYQNIRKVRESMGPSAQQLFWKNIQCIVEKDVVRTDRSHPYFKGDNNPNIEVLKHILLNYAVANPNMGYTQGMSDLLAPILAAVQHEAESYWCFAGLMTRTIFVSSPKDSDMDQQLTYLRELLRITLPKFHYHLKLLGEDALELLFCHRWILLCFKREFNEEDVLSIWEACWSRYQSDYFHLFLCVAIVAIYGDDVVEQRLPADEILLHFSSLAMHMNGQLVLKKARGLLHKFRKRLKIPCTLYGLCSQVNAGMWDSGHAPTVECIGHLSNQMCPYNSTPTSPVIGVE